MAITNGYTSLATLKAKLGIAGTDTADDAELERVITAVSREIDEYTGRRFWAAEETRYYGATDPGSVIVDDILSVAELATDEDGDRVYETVWSASDYELEPANAPAAGEPYWRICVTPNGQHAFPTGDPRAIRVKGMFGYASTTPADVEEACLAQCVLQFAAGNVQGGIEPGSPSPATRVSLHPFVQNILGAKKRWVAG